MECLYCGKESVDIFCSPECYRSAGDEWFE